MRWQTSPKLEKYSGPFNITRMIDFIFDRYNKNIYFLFFPFKSVGYLSIMLRTVKNLILTYALCIQNVSIISEDKTVNKIQRTFLFTGLLISKSPGSLQQNSKNWKSQEKLQTGSQLYTGSWKKGKIWEGREKGGGLFEWSREHYQRRRLEWAWCVWETGWLQQSRKNGPKNIGNEAR